MENKVEYYRKLNNLTQEELARIINITCSQLRNIEKNRTERPNVEIAIKLKNALHVEHIEDIFIL